MAAARTSGRGRGERAQRFALSRRPLAHGLVGEVLARPGTVVGDELADAAPRVLGQAAQRLTGLRTRHRAGARAEAGLELLVGEVLLATGEARRLQPVLQPAPRSLRLRGRRWRVSPVRSRRARPAAPEPRTRGRRAGRAARGGTRASGGARRCGRAGQVGGVAQPAARPALAVTRALRLALSGRLSARPGGQVLAGGVGHAATGGVAGGAGDEAAAERLAAEHRHARERDRQLEHHATAARSPPAAAAACPSPRRRP